MHVYIHVLHDQVGAASMASVWTAWVPTAAIATPDGRGQVGDTQTADTVSLRVSLRPSCPAAQRLQISKILADTRLCTQYLIEYSIYTSVVLDMFTTDPHTKSTPAVAGVSQGGAVPYGRATRTGPSVCARMMISSLRPYTVCPSLGVSMYGMVRAIR